MALGASLAGVVVYLALSWVQKMPLVAMTAGTHGSVALIAMYCGVITMSMRRVVSTGQLELGSAHAIRRNLLVMWTMSLVMACLGWFAFAVGISMAHVPVGASAILVDLPVSGVLVAYTGTVAVLARRLLRGA